VAGVIDSAHERITGEKAAFFGFFECIDDATVAADLFHTAEAWAREQGMTKIIGPMNPTTNDECGLLVEGFDLLPSFMMPYNPAYYQRLVEGNGYVKAKDLLAYGIDMATIPMDRLTKIGKKVRQRIQGLEIRPVKRKSLGADLEKIKEIYNEAWEDNWGFVPMTDAEVDFMADRLKPLLMEGLVWVAEVDRAPVGFLLAMPDFNPVLKPLRGRLLTPRILGFLPYAMGWKKTQGSRVLTLGVKKSYRGRGLETAMLIEGLHTGYQAGFTVSEASWILEDNVMMRRMLEAIDGKVTKRYRLYEKAL
jgi:GNAT superfamily N-acetyltransferase